MPAPARWAMLGGMNADAVVIGAGVMGAAIALELARTGRRVTVVDRGGVGHGSTSASSAVIRFNFSTWAGVASSWEAVHHWRSWADYLGAPAHEPLARFERTGMVMLDVSRAPRELFRPLFDRAGVPYQEWDADTLAERVPGLDPGRFWPPARLTDARFWAEPAGRLGAVYTPDAGYVTDPALAARNLADAAGRHGARFLLGTAVTGVDRTPERAEGVRLADGTRLAAPVVVNAAGPWSGRVNALAGVGAEFTIGLRPMRQEVHHVPAPPGGLGPCLADLDLGTYLRPDTDGGLLVGGTEPECDPMQWLDDPGQAHPHPTAELFEAQVTRAARRFPDLGVPNRPRGVVGVYDVADDWTPVYDRTDLPGFYVAVGTSGNQFKNAPVVGQFLAAIIDTPAHDEKAARFVGPHTGLEIDLSAYSRKRAVNQGSSGTVMG
ncbi:FAD-binding oxidoreductase [Pseudonocardia eucalypti]|uniref:FAD-binding oxidoreductase n=1 Tax=Pseudonocardia eucalypti TaxID=648755 RepID=A0ABP9QVV6_9PSEU|nr:glycine/D-amino acid oxidase-like deaminating enzyme [Pseudonocardia eucalypti]